MTKLALILRIIFLIPVFKSFRNMIVFKKGISYFFEEVYIQYATTYRLLKIKMNK